MSLLSFAHPDRKEYFGKPIWHWVNACADADIARRAFVEKCVNSNGCPVEEMEFIRDAPAEFLSAFATEDRSISDEFFRILGVHQDPWIEPVETHVTQGVQHGSILVLDTETTGTSKMDAVVELAYVLYDNSGKQVFSFNELWATDVSMNPFAQRIHKITVQDLQKNGRDPRAGLEDFGRLCEEVLQKNGIIVAHNKAFDARMLRQTATQVGASWPDPEMFCTMQGCKRRAPEEIGNNAKNGQVYNFLNGPPLGQMHRALPDCQATAFIYLHGRKLGWWP